MGLDDLVEYLQTVRMHQIMRARQAAMARQQARRPVDVKHMNALEKVKLAWALAKSVGTEGGTKQVRPTAGLIAGQTYAGKFGNAILPYNSGRQIARSRPPTRYCPERPALFVNRPKKRTPY